MYLSGRGTGGAVHDISLCSPAERRDLCVPVGLAASPYQFPLAHHRLHLEISIVVVKRQTMFRTELHQCFDTFSRTLFVGDRDRIDDILLRTWLTMPAWAVAGTDSVLITRKADQLAEPCDLWAVSAVECPIPPTCPECQPWLRECHNVAFSASEVSLS